MSRKENTELRVQAKEVKELQVDILHRTNSVRRVPITRVMSWQLQRCWFSSNGQAPHPMIQKHILFSCTKIL